MRHFAFCNSGFELKHIKEFILQMIWLENIWEFWIWDYSILYPWIDGSESIYNLEDFSIHPLTID